MKGKEQYIGFLEPPHKFNDRGGERTYGWELEYGNLSVQDSVDMLHRMFGGKIDAGEKYDQKIEQTELGDFQVQFDTGLLTHKSYRKAFESLGIHFENWSLDRKHWEDKIEDLIASVGSHLIPVEIISPPLRFDQFYILENLRKATSFVYAFGVHINPEIPSVELKSLIRHLQAFIIFYPWILESSQIDISRRLTHFINPFPDEYIQLILSMDYRPDAEGFIKDYHQYNPDRNRPLDLYPLLSYLYPEPIEKLGDLGPVSSRPTYHYRLPNCMIDDPEWRLYPTWNRWIEVELLAQDELKMKEIMKYYWKTYHETMIGFHQKWSQISRNWLTYEH